MITLMMERPLPAGFDPNDADFVARHCRIAVDAHRAAGAHGLESWIAEDRIFGLVAVEREEDLAAYWRAAGVANQNITVRRIVRRFDPTGAAERS